MFSCKSALPLAVAVMVFSTPASMAHEVRHADAHVHGTGEMLLVIDGSTVSIQLSIPGADIVGFEHEPKNAEQVAAVDDAIAILSQPLQLFEFTPDAACAPNTAEANFITPAPDEHGHAEFEASYTLACADLASSGLTLTTQFFDVFDRSESLKVDALVDGTAVQATLARQQPTTVLR